jgi:hypothetical protein
MAWSIMALRTKERLVFKAMVEPFPSCGQLPPRGQSKKKDSSCPWEMGLCLSTGGPQKGKVPIRES